MVYESLPIWRLNQVRDLRMLLRYAVGTRSVRTAVPDWHDLCASLEETPPATEAVRKQREAAYTDQLNHFKQGINSLDFADGVVCPKLDHVREQLYHFYREHPTERHDMFDAYKTVYGAEGLVIDDIKLWLADIFQAAPGPRAVNRLPGVYLLYRHGMIMDGEPSVVRSAMLILRGSVDKTPYLSFQIAYPMTNEEGANDTATIAGNILGTLGHYYFIGADSGAAKSPYLLIAKQHAQDAAPRELAGLQMRHSHGNEVMSSRILIVRYSDDMTGAGSDRDYRKQFDKASELVSILRPSEIKGDERLTDRRRAKIANTIDMAKAPVLWLTPEQPVPDAPVPTPAKK